jgi:hypothetical protein
MLPADLVTLMHMLVHHMCVLVVANERLLLLPLKPVLKLGLWLWGQAVLKEQAYELITQGGQTGQSPHTFLTQHHLQ